MAQPQPGPDASTADRRQFLKQAVVAGASGAAAVVAQAADAPPKPATAAAAATAKGKRPLLAPFSGVPF